MSLLNSNSNLTKQLDDAITKRYKEKEAMVLDNQKLINHMQQRQQELLQRLKEKLNQ